MSDQHTPQVDPEQFTETNHPALHYQQMLADHLRMQRYRQAIVQTVRKGDLVADLGTGLGVLALMAVQAGARRVYAVDNRPNAIWMAERILRSNPGGDRVTLLNADARSVQLDEPVDLIVNELIGDFGTDENIHECVSAFADRNLNSAGSVLPGSLQTYLVPVEYGDEFRGIWRQDYFGLDLRAGMQYGCREQAVMYNLREQPKELAAPGLVENIRFGRDMPSRTRPVNLTFEITRSGRLQGFVGYFSATLSDGIVISNYPCYPTCHWENWHWPVTPPVDLEPGRSIAVSLDLQPNMVASGWRMEWEIL
ncbi:MAG: 50S ribosomal protein L11 methyltransferase [Gammaproteobacteria bacterium]|nr:50S ribosomal protein L11 methyltransferase [Gammaproteobacteria bacterium]